MVKGGEQDGANIPFSVGEGQAVIFSFDPETGILSIETSDDVPDGLITSLDSVQSGGTATLPPPVIAKPELVVIPGTIQSVLGLWWGLATRIVNKLPLLLMKNPKFG